MHVLSPMFSAMDASASGLGAHRLWLDALADNIANVNTVRATNEPAFQERKVVVKADPVGGHGNPSIGGGVNVSHIIYGDPAGRVAYSPDHPLADEDGLVRHPDMDLSTQMVSLISAQRGFQANAAAFERARNLYEAALEIGRS